MAGRPNASGSYQVDIGANDPGSSLVLVAPHASNPLPGGTARALWITVAGNINVQLENDVAAQVIPVTVGLFPFRVKYVKVTSTTATAYAVY